MKKGLRTAGVIIFIVSLVSLIFYAIGMYAPIVEKLGEASEIADTYQSFAIVSLFEVFGMCLGYVFILVAHQSAFNFIDSVNNKNKLEYNKLVEQYNSLVSKYYEEQKKVENARNDRDMYQNMSRELAKKVEKLNEQLGTLDGVKDRISVLHTLNKINNEDRAYCKIVLDELASGLGCWPGIYKIEHKESGRVYIGQSARPIIERIKEHMTISANAVASSVYKNGTLKTPEELTVDEAIQIFGANAFRYYVEKPIYNLTQDELNYHEKQLIAKYNSNVNGYNKTSGNSSYMEKFI